MKKVSAKKNTDRSLTVRFQEHGCMLEFDNKIPLTPTERELFCLYLKSGVDAFLELSLMKVKPFELSRSLLFLHMALTIIANALLNDEELDDDAVEHIVSHAPFDFTEGFVTPEWVREMYMLLLTRVVAGAQASQITVNQYMEKRRTSINARANLFIHIVENQGDEKFPFLLLVTYNMPVENSRFSQLTLGNVFDGDDEFLKTQLRAELKSIAQKSELLKTFIENESINRPVPLSAEDAYTLLKSVRLLTGMGYNLRIPNWWKRRSRRVEITLHIGGDAHSFIGMDELLSFDASLSFDGEELSKDELSKLLNRANGLIMIKGKWIDVDSDRLKETLLAYERAQELMRDGKITLRNAMRLSLNGGADEDDEIVNIRYSDNLKDVFMDMNSPERLSDIEIGSGFLTELRPYQRIGVNWLYLLHSMKLGACLSDDMGLGKTVQVIALLERLRLEGKRPSLLVIPASLLLNWQSELKRFAPNIRFKVLHSSYPDINDDAEPDLYITTYTMAARDTALRDRVYDTIVLDEAQAIKNPSTKQARAVKRLESQARISMTGTPIENRVSDLWSIFDFLNPSLLGSASEFSRVASSIQSDPNAALNLKRTVAPFILRRLKTDKSIIEELPEKIEMKSYCSLSNKQTALYQDVVDKLAASLDTVSGMSRRGLVLSTIMRLKQICNHPDQYLGSRAFGEEDSGKLIRLRELCEEIRDNHERVLVFTQFLEMCDPLMSFLTDVFGAEGLTLNGSVPVAKRGAAVNLFNGEEYIPFMVLTIKAGGVGLNLTGANHVIHFDRWWNPATENQATDRAYRIGQTKNVIVHKFITTGTLEEKIDEMIEGKRTLANNIIPSMGESGLTELMNNELINFLRLN